MGEKERKEIASGGASAGGGKQAGCGQVSGEQLRGEGDRTWRLGQLCTDVDFCSCRGPGDCYWNGGGKGTFRSFDTGASRSSEEGKLDPDGFLSHLAIMRYLEYMHQHRTMPDGTLRASDNWKQGIPIESYMKSLYRHFLDVWCYHSDGDLKDPELEEALCAVIFNASGFLHELLKRRA